jgi:hypothetical protein
MRAPRGSFYEGTTCQVPSGSPAVDTRRRSGSLTSPGEPRRRRRLPGEDPAVPSWPVVTGREHRLVDPPSIRMARTPAPHPSFVRVQRRTTVGRAAPSVTRWSRRRPGPATSGAHQLGLDPIEGSSDAVTLSTILAASGCTADLSAAVHCAQRRRSRLSVARDKQPLVP